MRSTQGFTLIELMVVVAIIAILAALALPAYQDYMARSQVSEGLSVSSGLKAAVVEYYGNYGIWPVQNSDIGIASASSIKGKFVSSVDLSTTAGAITVTYSGTSTNAKISGKRLVIEPVFNGGSVSWKKGATTTVDSKYLPSNFR